MCSLFAFCVGGSLEVMQSRVDTRPLRTRSGPFPPLKPSFLETAKRGLDAGSEIRFFVLFPASETAITGRYR